MMSEKDIGAKKIDELIKEATCKKEAQDQRIEDDRRKSKLAKIRADKKYTAWIRQYEARARSSAIIIWGWYKEFISSGKFRQLSGILKQLSPDSKIFVSEIHICQTPTCVHGFSADYYIIDKQMMSINAEGKLYVYNCIKYGKSYPILKSEDLLRYVRLPILIAVAETITDGSIWGIVKIS